MRRMTTRRGFTLAEVAFSIAIIGLAVVVSMAVFASGIKAHSQTSLRMVAAATATYLMDVGLGRDFATSDSRPGNSLLTNISIIRADLPTMLDPQVITLSTATTWDGVAIVPTEILLENPLGGADIIPSSEFILQYPDFGNPAANLIFSESTPNPLNGIRWRKLSIWGCDWRNKPSGITMRAPLLVEFMYYDYHASTH